MTEEIDHQAALEVFHQRLRDAGLFEAYEKAFEDLDEDDLRDVLLKFGEAPKDVDAFLAVVSNIAGLRPKGFDPNGFVPRDKHDHESVDRAIAAGYPAVAPVLSHLLECIHDMNHPVAQDLAPFLASIGMPLVPHIKKAFETDDEIWKYWIIGVIFQHSPELAKEFRDEMTRIAHNPTESERAEELPEQALDVLNHYGWLAEDEQDNSPS